MARNFFRKPDETDLLDAVRDREPTPLGRGNDGNGPGARLMEMAREAAPAPGR